MISFLRVTFRLSHYGQLPSRLIFYMFGQCNLLQCLVQEVLPENVQTRICYTGTKLGTKINNIKDPVTKSHQHDAVYYTACPEPDCIEDYTGETGGRLIERVIDHNGRGKKSHLCKHWQESNHLCVALSDFKIIGSNF